MRGCRVASVTGMARTWWCCVRDVVEHFLLFPLRLLLSFWVPVPCPILENRWLDFQLIPILSTHTSRTLRERERERERERDRDRDRDRDRERQRQRDRDRETDRQRQRQRQTCCWLDLTTSSAFNREEQGRIYESFCWRQCSDIYIYNFPLR